MLMTINVELWKRGSSEGQLEPFKLANAESSRGIMDGARSPRDGSEMLQTTQLAKSVLECVMLVCRRATNVY